jgi:hypothetical protein
VSLILAGAAFGQTAHKTFRRFWVVTGIISLLWAFGGYTPLYHLIILIPYTKYLRAPSTMIFVTALSVAILAAIGTERILARRTSPKYALGWIIGGAVFGVLMSVGGYSALVNLVGGSMATDYPEQVRAQVVDAIAQHAQTNTSSAIIGVWRSFIFVALCAGVIWGLVTDRIRPRHAAISLAVLLAVDLWSIERLYWMFSEPAATLFATDPAINAIQADIAKSGQGRVLPVPLSQSVDPLDRAFSGDVLMSHSLRIDSGYHGNELGMYQVLVDLDSGRVRFSPQYWRHENVRYFYTGADDSTMAQVSSQLKLPAFTKLAGPVRNAAQSMVYAYRIPADNPPAWVSATMVKAPQNQALATVLDPRFQPASASIVDTSAKDITAAQITTLPPPATTRASVTAYAPGAIDVSLDQPSVAGQALVVSENYFPGWHATADGKAAVVALMNYNLIGVALPAGAKTIQLRFTDAAYEKGKRVTLLAAILAVILWVGGAVVDRRRNTLPPATA